MVAVIEMRTGAFEHMPKPYCVWGPFHSPEVAHTWASRNLGNFEIYEMKAPDGVPVMFLNYGE